MHYKYIQLHCEEGVVRLTLNRPDKLNSFTGDMQVELRHALDAVQNADAGFEQARVLLLTGAGRGFCAGQDLSDAELQADEHGHMPDLGQVVERHYKPLVLRLQQLRVPTLCAVNGVAAGAGASVALACDMVVAKQSASFVQAFGLIGLLPDTGSTWFLPQRIGMARSFGLAMLGEKLSAQQAADWGLIWQVVPDAEFDVQVLSLAARLATAPTKALLRLRQALHAAPSHTLEQQLCMEAGFMRELGFSHDYAEGVAAFKAKRKPIFKGQ